MKKSALVIACGTFLLLAVGMVMTAETGKAYYVCNCQDNCSCNFVSAKPGKCNCGSPLAAMHLLAIENSNAVFCRCGKDCSCVRSKDDPKKCGCGKPVKMAGIKGKYVCSCGPNCSCGIIADAPGKCTCGKALKQVS